MLKKIMKSLLHYSSEESFSDADRSYRINERDLIFGNNSFVSFVRGVETINPITDNENHSTPIKPTENEKFCSFTEQQTSQSLNISDSEFFDSDKMKEFIRDDQAAHGNSLQQTTDCTGCSKWTPCSRKNTTSISFDDTKFNQQKSVSIGEFFGAFSETLRDSQKQHNPFLNVLTSTPIQTRKSMSMPSLMDLDSNELNYSMNSCQGDSSSMYLLKSDDTFKIATPKFRNRPPCDFQYHIGSTARKNIERLKKEERNLKHTDATTSFVSVNISEENTVVGQSNFPNDSRSTIALPCSSLSASIVGQWFIEPQSVMLDPHKGNRVRLINNSSKNLKYKTSYDSKLTNICPLSGTIPAMDEIGLRILISQYAKRELQSFECNINIIAGSSEKSIRVKYNKEEKSKIRRKRSFILH